MRLTSKQAIDDSVQFRTGPGRQTSIDKLIIFDRKGRFVRKLGCNALKAGQRELYGQYTRAAASQSIPLDGIENQIQVKHHNER